MRACFTDPPPPTRSRLSRLPHPGGWPSLSQANPLACQGVQKWLITGTYVAEYRSNLVTRLDFSCAKRYGTLRPRYCVCDARISRKSSHTAICTFLPFPIARGGLAIGQSAKMPMDDHSRCAACGQALRNLSKVKSFLWAAKISFQQLGLLAAPQSDLFHTRGYHDSREKIKDAASQRPVTRAHPGTQAVHGSKRRRQAELLAGRLKWLFSVHAGCIILLQLDRLCLWPCGMRSIGWVFR